MDQYQRIAFVIAVISGAGFLAYVAAFSVLPKNIGEKISGAAKVLRVPTKQQRRQSAIQQVVSGSHLLSCYIHFLSGSEPCCIKPSPRLLRPHHRSLSLLKLQKLSFSVFACASYSLWSSPDRHNCWGNDCFRHLQV